MIRPGLPHPISPAERSGRQSPIAWWAPAGRVGRSLVRQPRRGMHTDKWAASRRLTGARGAKHYAMLRRRAGASGEDAARQPSLSGFDQPPEAGAAISQSSSRHIRRVTIQVRDLMARIDLGFALLETNRKPRPSGSAARFIRLISCT
jgi:hypothetical protein